MTPPVVSMLVFLAIWVLWNIFKQNNTNFFEFRMFFQIWQYGIFLNDEKFPNTEILSYSDDLLCK